MHLIVEYREFILRIRHIEKYLLNEVEFGPKARLRAQENLASQFYW